jgi:hypothetical protein
MSRDSSVGTASCYGFDGPGIGSQQGPGFPYSSRPTLASYLGTVSLGYSDRGVALTTHHHLGLALKKEYSYISASFCYFVAGCTVEFGFKGK